MCLPQAPCGWSSEIEIRGKPLCWRKVKGRVRQNTAWAVDPTGEFPRNRGQRVERGDGKPRALRGSEEETGAGAGLW